MSETPPLSIVYRYCDRLGKDRPEWFSKTNSCLNAARAFAKCPWYLLYDQPHTENSFHLMVGILEREVNLNHARVLNCGVGGSAAAAAINYACKLDGWVYLLEDDYLHTPEAVETLAAGIRAFSEPGAFLTLYDHPDKYMQGGPNPFIADGGELCRARCDFFRGHWKHTNSTTMTFACHVDTLRAQAEEMRRFCEGPAPEDFSMWRRLSLERGCRVWSSIPGKATHCEQKWLAPLVDWEAVAKGG